jgi:hypothetical protein
MIRPFRYAMALLPLAAVASPVLAQPGWSGGWGGFGPSRFDSGMTQRDDREGRVDAERFLAEGAGAVLTSTPQAPIAVVVQTLAGSTTSGREQATFEAAVIDQLAKAGYDTTRPDATGGQLVEITVTRDQLEPAEEKRSPISGTATMGVSNRGSMMGLSLAYDGTKPRGALISTNMEIRIRDRLSGRALYEARARIATREGSSKWNDTAISTRLAAALFERFPSSSPLGR